MSRTSHSQLAADELRHVTSALVRRLRSESAGQTFTWPQLSVLKRLETDGPLTAADLARAELITPQAMGALVAELEEAGHVKRTEDRADNRRRLVSITAKGGRALAQGRAARQSWLAQALDTHLGPDEQRTLLDALALLRRIIEP